MWSSPVIHEVGEMRRKLHWKTRFQVNRVARGWIVVDQASDKLVSFHVSQKAAEYACSDAKQAARAGYMPVDLEKLIGMQAFVERHIQWQEHELVLNGYGSQRYAKIIRRHLKWLTQLRDSLSKQIEREHKACE